MNLHSLIPKPQSIKTLPGVFKTNQSLSLKPSTYIDKALVLELINLFSNYQISNHSNWQLDFLWLNELESQGYQLAIKENKILIYANSDSGFYYGLISFLLLSSINKSLPYLLIKDKPRFAYRGMLLDVARHFIPKEQLVSIIKLCSYLKFNTLHLHVSDDQGWRIQLDQFPLLTTLGSNRQDYLAVKPKQEPIFTPSGFYNKEEIKDLLEVARKHHVKILPEIDIPGHTSAFLAAYPECSCHGKKVKVSTRTGIHQDVLCVSSETTQEMIQNLLLEVCELFETDTIHIGGDEVILTQWASCPSCLALAKSHQFDHLSKLQTLFTNQIIDFLKEHHIQAIVWNDNVKDNSFNESAWIQHWQYPTKDSFYHRVRSLSNPIIESTMKSYYFDYPEAFIHVDQVYLSRSPLNTINQEQWLGIECALWSETIADYPTLLDRMFPRILAVAEHAWTNIELLDLTEFKKNLPLMLKTLHKAEKNIPLTKTIIPFARIKHIFNMLNMETVKTLIKNKKIKNKKLV